MTDAFNLLSGTSLDYHDISTGFAMPS